MPQQRSGRSWGTRFDSLTSSDSLSSNPDSAAMSSHRVFSPPPSVSADEVHDSHDRILQDASIFIGSLPANIEYAELTAMLSQHLSEHPQVKGIKVVRDSKGGTCAFIQCQDAEAASSLMHNLHATPPQPFLGRYLRYEPARAFRTLLISYRTPRQYVHYRDLPRKTNFSPAEDPQFVELQLPDAMRIFRTSGNKQLSVLFNSEALAIPHTAGTDPGLLLVPVPYDAETLFRIVSMFGSIEYFGPCAHGDEGSQVPASFPAPHNGPRSPGMDTGYWKVKWAHRDDCVSALLTLRRIPHLTVTWAHQSNTTFREQGSYYNPRVAPVMQASHSWRSRGAPPALRAATDLLPISCSSPALRTAQDPFNVEHSSEVKTANRNSECDRWQHATNSGKLHLPRQSRPRAVSLTHDRPHSMVSLPSRESAEQLSSANWESANCTRWADHNDSFEFKGSPSAPEPNLTSPYLGHRVVSSDSICNTSKEGQDIDARLPCQSDFGTSPIAPRTPVSLMLRTPTTASYMGDFQSMSFKDFDSQGSLPRLSQEKRGDHVVDPTTIFVGGLEMFGPNAWDEGKVRALFSRYGVIEAVKVIRPSNKRSAFAFVRFNNTDAPMRAIRGEHNRMLDGRLIRVQLRDWNPSYRPSWRPGFSKNSNLQPLCGSDDHSVDPKLARPRDLDIPTHIANLQPTDTPVPLSSVEACDLNEVQEVTGILLPEASSDDVACGSPREAREVETFTGVKQGEPIPPDATLASSQTSAVLAPALPAAYTAPTVQYYQGWIPNFVPPFPYQMPFIGQPYPGYHFPPPVMPPAPQSNGSDHTGTSPNTSFPFSPASVAYPTFMPYPPFGHGSDSGQATVGHSGVTGNPTLIHGQAPLIPTGFIHGDQGMLVPVYPPDALNQYMIGNQDQAKPPNSGTPEGQPPVSWHPYPPPPIRPQAVIFHSYINPPPTAPPPPHLGAQAWIPGHPWQGVAPQLGNTTGVPGRRVSSSPGGGLPSIPIGTNFDRNQVPPRRQYRRDNHSQYQKNNFARGTAGRIGKATSDAPRSSSDIQPVLQCSVPDGPIDANWQRWNTEQGNLA